MTTGVRSGIGLKIALCSYSSIPQKWSMEQIMECLLAKMGAEMEEEIQTEKK
jgi:hypothetical protein